MKVRVRFLLGFRKDKPNDIHVEVMNDYVRIRQTLNISLPSEKNWDANRQMVLRVPNADQINQFLTDTRHAIERFDLECLNANKEISKADIKRIIEGRPTTNHSDHIIDIFTTYNHREYEMKTIKYPSFQKYKTMLMNLQKFIDIYKGQKNSVLTFNEFTSDFIEQLEIHLQSMYEMSTVAKFHINLKKFLAKAIVEKRIKENPYDNFKIKKAHTKERDVLTEAQLYALEKLDREKIRRTDHRLEEVLDRFLLSCYCGLRIGDNSSLLKSEIKTNKNGEMVIDKITEKMEGTRVILPIDLLFDGKGKLIVERYLLKYPDIKTLFPEIPDQKINSRLKTLALMIGANFNLTFHIARHTCATLLAEKTGNPYVVKQILGHADIKTSMIYIHASYASTRKGLENVIWSKDTVRRTANAGDINIDIIHNLKDQCQKANLNPLQTSVIISEAIEHPDQIELIGIWVRTLDEDTKPESLIAKIKKLAV